MSAAATSNHFTGGRKFIQLAALSNVTAYRHRSYGPKPQPADHRQALTPEFDP
jgi:hypothetical protein